MRNVLFLLLGAMPFTALANDGQLIIRKTNASGFTTTAGFRNERCELYRNKLVVTRTFGLNPGVKVVEERQVQVTDDIDKILEEATKEVLAKTENLLCDGPSTSVEVGGTQATGELQVLYSTGGCGTPSLNRQGPYSRILRDMIDGYCSRTIAPPQP